MGVAYGNIFALHFVSAIQKPNLLIILPVFLLRFTDLALGASGDRHWSHANER